MKKFDSSNILFALCLAFVILVMLGLIFQSCRSARLDNSNQNLTEEKREQKTFLVNDHVSLSQLSEAWLDNTRIVIRDYVAVPDSFGKPVPVLKKETELTSDKSYQRDSTLMQCDKSTSVDSTKTDSRSESNISQSVDKKPFIGFSIGYILIPVLFLIAFLLYKRFKKK